MESDTKRTSLQRNGTRCWKVLTIYRTILAVSCQNNVKKTKTFVDEEQGMDGSWKTATLWLLEFYVLANI